MANGGLIIDDDYLNAMEQYFVNQGNYMEELLKEYRSILKSVRSNGIESGAVADTLDAFMELESALSGKLRDISKNNEKNIREFKKNINAIDKY